MKKRIFHWIYWLLQFSWGIDQNVIGLFWVMILLIRNPQRERMFYHGAFVIDWDDPISCMGLGMFIFIHDFSDPQLKPILRHEYGHTIQSLLLGPLFLFVIALPSLLWARNKNFIQYRQKHHIAYDWLYCERWANHLANKILKKDLL